jgi:hypothetical protein
MGQARDSLFDDRIVEESPEWQKRMLTAVASERNRKLRSHGLDVFHLVYGHSIRQARKEALADPQTSEEVKNRIMECIQRETIKKARSEGKRTVGRSKKKRWHKRI